MTLASALVSFLALIVPAAAQNVPRTPALSSLTVPASRLPEGCSLAANSGPGAVANPWIGADRPRLTELRRSVEPWSVRVPDALPMAQPGERAFTQQAAAGLVEGYIATYSEFGNMIVVRAIRFERAPEPLFPPRSVQFEIGLVRATVSGPVGPCRKAIDAYLRAL